MKFLEHLSGFVGKTFVLLLNFVHEVNASAPIARHHKAVGMSEKKFYDLLFRFLFYHSGRGQHDPEYPDTDKNSEPESIRKNFKTFYRI